MSQSAHANSPKCGATRATERPVDVDARSGLFGLLTHPERQSSSTGFILLNAGILHRVGPFRLYVDIARALAKSGFPSLRLDQSGKGDSDFRANCSLTESKNADIVAAAECLTYETGATEFVVGGLCSGADDALQLAHNLPDLRGLLMFDGYAPRNARYFVNRYGPKLLDVRSWLNRLQGNTSTNPAKANLREWAPREEMLGHYAQALDRGVKILAIFTSGACGYYAYANQLSSALPSVQANALLTERYFPTATHVLSSTAHRRMAIDELSTWATRSFN